MAPRSKVGSSPKAKAKGKARGRGNTAQEKADAVKEDPPEEESEKVVKLPPIVVVPRRAEAPRPDQEMLRVVHVDAVAGNPSVIEDIYRLIWQGEEEVNQRNYSGFTPLAVAAAAGDGPLTALLLERRADVSISSVDRSELPLHHAARFGRDNVVVLLAEITKLAGLIDAPNTLGFPALQLAAAGGHLDIVKLLLKLRASASSRNQLRGGVTALHGAILAGATELAEILMLFGAEVDATDQLGRSPLYGAAQRCDAQCLALLLRNRADPHQRDQSGITPLDMVPIDHMYREKVVNLLTSFKRGIPVGRRCDSRFELRTGHEGEVI
jgi:ankyrin repeat protein